MSVTAKAMTTGRQKSKNPKKSKKYAAGTNLAQRYTELLQLRARLLSVESSRTSQ